MSHFGAQATTEKNIVTKSIWWRFKDFGTVEPFDVFLTHNKLRSPNARAKENISMRLTLKSQWCLSKVDRDGDRKTANVKRYMHDNIYESLI